MQDFIKCLPKKQTNPLTSKRYRNNDVKLTIVS